MNRTVKAIPALLLCVVHGPWLVASSTLAADENASQPVRLNVHGVELHYVARGSGAPVVLVHGGLADYRELAPLADELSAERSDYGNYRTITYSRRHSYPNANLAPGADNHMSREVADLAGLIEALELAPANVAGTSYGGFVVLMLAIQRPELVRSLTVAEPPLLHWLHDIEGGTPAYEEFYDRVMEPSRAAFASGDGELAVRSAMDYFAGPGGFDILPTEVQQILLGNMNDWQAITTEPGALPEVTRESVAGLDVPVLVLSGGNSAAVHRLIDPELLRTLAHGERVVIDDASHEMCVEQPAACAQAIDRFIGNRID